MHKYSSSNTAFFVLFILWFLLLNLLLVSLASLLFNASEDPSFGFSAESNILAISEDINRIFEVAVKKLQEYIYVKGFHTIKELKNMRDIENELKKYWKVQFTLGDNINVGQELLIQEKIMI